MKPVLLFFNLFAYSFWKTCHPVRLFKTIRLLEISEYEANWSLSRSVWKKLKRKKVVPRLTFSEIWSTYWLWDKDRISCNFSGHLLYFLRQYTVLYTEQQNNTSILLHTYVVRTLISIINDGLQVTEGPGKISKTDNRSVWN